MSPFSKEYTPVIKTDDLKKAPAPKKAPNVFDTGTPQERMQHAAKPLQADHRPMCMRPSTM